MLRLYKARAEFFALKAKGGLAGISLYNHPLRKLLSAEPLQFEGSISTKESFRQFEEDGDAEFGIVSEVGEGHVGIVRKVSLEQLERQGRFEALQLPIRSIMTRSFITLDEACTLGEAVETILIHKAFGIMTVSKSKVATRACTIDFLHELFLDDTQERAAHIALAS